MRAPTEITLVRHAESTSNVAGLWQGHGDAALSEDGLTQVEALGRRLSRWEIDVVVSSDLTRAAATAGATNVPVETDAAWREIDVGAWEGLTREEVADRFPEEVARLAAGEMVPVGGGESWADVQSRVVGALERLRASLAPGARAVVITHGGVIMALLAALTGNELRKRRPFGPLANTSLTTIRYHEDAPTSLVRFNDTTHLGPLGPYATARHRRGDAVVALVAHGTRGELRAGVAAEVGRSRGAPDLVAAEHVAGWYGGVETILAMPTVEARNVAAVLAQRWGLAVEDPFGGSHDTLEPVLDAIRTRHQGKRVAFVAPSTLIAQYAHTALAPTEGSARTTIASPERGAITHVVLGERSQTLADVNVSGADR